MFNYTAQNQLEIFDFKTEFQSKLDPNNRWVKMAKLLDWDRLAEVYSQNFSSTMGAKGIDARIIIGALIIKHIEAKDDRGTIDAIKENPYMQFFLGFDHFSSEAVFDPSLFVHIRKRLCNGDFDKMNQVIIAQALNLNEKDKTKEERKNTDEDNFSHNDSSHEPTNKGKLQMDATIADAHIKFPTDLSLLNDSREKSEKLIDRLCLSLRLPKPRTYRREARKKWLNLSKSKKNSFKQIQNGIKQQLNYLKRNIKSIDKILEDNQLSLCCFDKKEYKYLLVIKELHRQQL
ncbi:transposase, partial [Flavobacterium sp. F-60]